MPKQLSRKICIDILCEWEESSKFIDSIIESKCNNSALTSRDRAFVQNITLGVIRNLTVLETWLYKLRKGKIDSDLRLIIFLGLYQILMMRVPDHAAVNETVNLARTRARGLVNAILRRSVREQDQLLNDWGAMSPADKYSIPDHIYSRWEKQFGIETAERIAFHSNKIASLTVRSNPLRGGLTDKDKSDTGATPVKDYPEFYEVTKLPFEALNGGRCYAQDPSTSIAPNLLNPKSSHKVLDVCAAPGGKTSILSLCMKNKGHLTATDIEGPRSNRLIENLENLGVHNVTIHSGDILNHENPLLNQSNKYDRILIDVPCSNTGVFRRRVDAKWRLMPGFTKDLTRLQFRMVESIIPLLKEGGKMVYSTCSIDDEENGQIVAKIIKKFPNLKKIDEVLLIPQEDRDGAYASLIG